MNLISTGNKFNSNGFGRTVRGFTLEGTGSPGFYYIYSGISCPTNTNYYNSDTDKSSLCDGSFTDDALDAVNHPEAFCDKGQRVNQGDNWDHNFNNHAACVSGPDYNCNLYNSTNSCQHCSYPFITTRMD